MRLTIDSFAWVELIRGTHLGTNVRRLVEKAEEAFTPAIVVAEVAHRFLRDGFSEAAVRGELRAMGEASLVVPIDHDLAVAGSIATRELRTLAAIEHLAPPGLSDGLVLATARTAESRLLTGDRHFRNLRETLWLG